ncbi:GLPGLI family protein [Bacteroides pyogenes]|uniref:GLPGLI family protein n=1 Tax=Bacteroides pyogenes TaxID=310300 RepID=UPI0027DB6C96|nr:GLPGLI family protein [uncultured Bacteroides sp.]
MEQMKVKANLLMRKFLFLFFLALLCVRYYAKAQMPPGYQSHAKYMVLDSANYIITYEVQAISGTATNDRNTDIQILQIGNDVSKTYSKYLFDNDSVCTMLIQKGTRNIPIYQGLASPEDIYKNHPKGKMTVSYRTFMTGPVLKYEEPMPTFKWELLSDRKTLLNYQCQKSVCTFRGRTYIAWFTPEIPLSEGPWKFHGLPGLILQVSDDKNEFEYQCIGIQKLKKKQPIKYWKWDYQSSTREKMRPFIKNMHERPNAFFKSVTGSGIHIKGGANADLLSYPYNPIELE